MKERRIGTIRSNWLLRIGKYVIKRNKTNFYNGRERRLYLTERERNKKNALPN